MGWQDHTSSAENVELQHNSSPSKGFPIEHATNSPSSASSLNDQDFLPKSQGIGMGYLSSQAPLKFALGKPTAKKRLPALHALSALTSLVCLAIGVAAVASERLSWSLSKDNGQLIVIGFLLGIMNLCLATVTPMALLLLEARFGSSTLQNYDGLLRNRVLGAQLSLPWRLLLASAVALPLALSVAYKTFTGGESRVHVKAADYDPSYASYYGMFALPGFESLGQGKGVASFTNATTSFLSASSLQKWKEPAFDAYRQVYGYNVVKMNNVSTAVLDLPHPAYLSKIQALLALGESWNVHASVYGTVAEYDNSRKKDPKRFDKDFLDFCHEANGSPGAKGYLTDMSKDAVNLISRPSPGDLSLHYIGIAPANSIDMPTTCEELSSHLQPFNVSRQMCYGTWSITRGSIELTDGACTGTVLRPTFQKPIVNNTHGLFPAVYYMPSLLEILGPFAHRKDSPWTIPSMATSIAAMMWSRIAAVNADSLRDIMFDNILPRDPAAMAQSPYGETTMADAGLFYKLEDEVVYARPTLRRVPALYFVLAIQPALTLLAVALALVLHSTPIDEGFGLISILAGMRRGDLDALRGASLSGRLSRDVKFVIQPRNGGSGREAVEYGLRVGDYDGAGNGRLRGKAIYD